MATRAELIARLEMAQRNARAASEQLEIVVLEAVETTRRLRLAVNDLKAAQMREGKET